MPLIRVKKQQFMCQKQFLICLSLSFPLPPSLSLSLSLSPSSLSLPSLSRYSLSLSLTEREGERREQTFISSYFFVISLFSLLLQARRSELTNRASLDDSGSYHPFLVKPFAIFSSFCLFLWKKRKNYNLWRCATLKISSEWLWTKTWKVIQVFFHFHLQSNSVIKKTLRDHHKMFVVTVIRYNRE